MPTTVNIMAMLFMLLVALSYPQANNFDSGKQAFDNEQYEEAKDILLPLAQNGDPDAMYLIGQMYDRGFGLQANITKASETYARKAFEWYSRAGELGHAEAAFMMTLKEPLNNAVNIKWATISAQNGSLRGTVRLADLYWFEKDFNQSMKWYSQAANLGHGETAVFLGTTYANGSTGVVDMALSMKWLKHAKKLGFTPVLDEMFRICQRHECEHKDNLEAYKGMKVLVSRGLRHPNVKRLERVYKIYEAEFSPKEIQEVNETIKSCQNLKPTQC